MELADAHAHLFDGGFIGRYGRPCSGGDDVTLYQALRHDHSIGTALVVGYEGDPRYRGNSRFIAKLAGLHSWIAPLAYVPPSAPKVPAAAFAGISLYLLEPEDADHLAGWPQSILDGLGDAEAIVSINGPPAALSQIRQPLAKLERCRVLISHLGEPGSYARAPSRERASRALEPLLALADFPHVGVKLSGLYGISNPPHHYPHRAARPFVDLLADTFGPQRLYWGSDFSPALDFVSFAQTIDAVARLPWSDADIEAVMGGNLRCLLQRRPCLT